MAIDPCYYEMLAGSNSALFPPAADISLDAYRVLVETPLYDISAARVHDVIERSITFSGRSVPVRIYHPTADRNLPVILFFHGGGFVVCSAKSHDAMCRDLALKSGAVVVSVDYRRAPEVPFPGPLDDCFEALEWVSRNAHDLGADALRIAVCGDSAGGNLTIATALRARANGPRICRLGIIYPMIDPLCAFPSIVERAAGPVLSKEIIKWFWDSYLGADGDKHNPLVAVLKADLRDLPPATVLTAEYDPLRDEGEAFARALRAAGNLTVSRRYLGMAHGFFSMPELTPIAAHAMTDLANDLKAAFSA